MMSNTKTATKPEANGKPDEATGAEEAKAAQDAQQAEATGATRTVEFDGTNPDTGEAETFAYEILDGQPSPTAFTYLARYAVNNEGLAFIPAMIEIIGADQWSDWCERHESKQMMEFFYAVERVASAGN